MYMIRMSLQVTSLHSRGLTDKLCWLFGYHIIVQPGTVHSELFFIVCHSRLKTKSICGNSQQIVLIAKRLDFSFCVKEECQ